MFHGGRLSNILGGVGLALAKPMADAATDCHQLLKRLLLLLLLR